MDDKKRMKIKQKTLDVIKIICYNIYIILMKGMI